MMVERATAADYYSLLLKLRPTGPAWAVDDAFWLAIADDLTRVHNRALDLFEEGDPRTTLDLLARWETTAGLPDGCLSAAATTLQERRRALVYKLTSRGGQSIAFFRSIIAALGYQATIIEYRPFICGRSRCGDRLNGPASVRHVWRVTVAGVRITRFRAGSSRCAEPLIKVARGSDLECVLNRHKPAHTRLIFDYEE
jgi:uncharacterized protein YmfQ (DUF2313 family)